MEMTEQAMPSDPDSSDGTSDADDDTGMEPGGESTSTPRWVRVFGIIAIVLMLVFVVVHLLGGGFRGHTP